MPIGLIVGFERAIGRARRRCRKPPQSGYAEVHLRSVSTHLALSSGEFLNFLLTAYDGFVSDGARHS
jgi:hypothetical protein